MKKRLRDFFEELEDGTLIINLTPLPPEGREERLKAWNRKKWKRSLGGTDGLTYDCEACGDKFLFDQHDEGWLSQIMGDLVRNPVVCLDCRTKED